MRTPMKTINEMRANAVEKITAAIVVSLCR
jgi:hypothetical protein